MSALRPCLRPRPIQLLVVAALMVLSLSTTASAAEGYRLEASTCAGFGGGGYDAKGGFYQACGTKIRYRNYATGAESMYTLGAGAYTASPAVYAHDVAPSPDGSYVYVNTRDQGIVRYTYNRANNTYARDAWTAKPFPYGAQSVRMDGLWIATDAYGYIYAPSWTYTTIVKYAPNGTYMTRFGQYTNSNRDQAGSWANGEFYWRLGGVGVSRDGRQVYAGEVGNNRVQRFDWQLSGDYAFALKFGNTAATDPKRVGSCTGGMFAAPYDVGVDPWGYVYVANTTCTQMQKFTSTGTFLFKAQANTRTPGQVRTHGIAVDARGNVSFGETSTRLVRTTAEPGPWPAITKPVADTTAPTLSQVTLPTTTTTQAITVAITATDDTTITHVRFANEDGVWQAWAAYAANSPHTLTAGDGAKGVYVQVRDAAGRESTVLYRTTWLSAAAAPAPAPAPAPGTADTVAPALRGATNPATTNTRTVTVSIDAIDDTAVTQVRFANEDGNWLAWTAYAANNTHTLSANDGPKGVYVQVRDAAGNESTVLYRTTRLSTVVAAAPDTVEPTLTNVTIPATTTTRAITVSITANDNVGITHMRFANEDGNWLAWTAYAANSTHTLSANNGPKGVYVQVRDAAGNESTVLYRTTRLAA